MAKHNNWDKNLIEGTFARRGPSYIQDTRKIWDVYLPKKGIGLKIEFTKNK